MSAIIFLLGIISMSCCSEALPIVVVAPDHLIKGVLLDDNVKNIIGEVFNELQKLLRENYSAFLNWKLNVMNLTSSSGRHKNEFKLLQRSVKDADDHIKSDFDSSVNKKISKKLLLKLVSVLIKYYSTPESYEPTTSSISSEPTTSSTTSEATTSSTSSEATTSSTSSEATTSSTSSEATTSSTSSEATTSSASSEPTTSSSQSESTTITMTTVTTTTPTATIPPSTC